MGEAFKALRHAVQGWVLLSSAVLFWPAQSIRAETYIYTDLDNTFFESRAALNGGFQTRIKLFLLQRRSNVLQTDPDAAKYPTEIEVTQGEFERIEDFLGKFDTADGNGTFGSLDRNLRTADAGNGTVQLPVGYYGVRHPESFVYFKGDYLLADIQAAEKSGKPFKGKFWYVAVAALSDPGLAQHFATLSARGHSLEEYQRAFDYLIQKKYLKHAPNFRLSRSLMHPNSERYGIGTTIAQQKASILEEALLALGRAPVNPAHLVSHPNGGTEKVAYHTLIYADDNQRTLDTIFERLRPQVMGRLHRVKVVLINTGYQTEIKESMRPEAFVITETGQARKASALELLGEPMGWTEATLAERMGRTCSLILAGDSRKSEGDDRESTKP